MTCITSTIKLYANDALLYRTIQNENDVAMCLAGGVRFSNFLGHCIANNF